MHTASRRLHLSGEQLVINLCYTFISDCHTVWWAEECASRFYLNPPGKSLMFSSERSRLFFQAILNSPSGNTLKHLRNQQDISCKKENDDHKLRHISSPHTKKYN